MKPAVSVFIITYNHAPYIRRCIESVLMQKTSFHFELVIGEDCSKDGTSEIVFDYAKKFPEIIRVVTTSAKVGPGENWKRTINECQAEYIAQCEGDDYWIDPQKLQKQYKTMTSMDTVFVTHNSIILNLNGENVVGIRLRIIEKDSGIITPEDIIIKKGNSHASSFFFKKDIFLQLPDWFYQSPVFDVPFLMIAATMGNVYFMNEIMSVYQHGTPGSWTDYTRQKDRGDTQRLKFIRDYLEMFKNYDHYTGHRYKNQILERSSEFLFKQIFEAGNKEYLNIPESQKKVFDFVVSLSHHVPGKQKLIIQRIMVNYLLDSYYK
jgi:glycosyltransferase involved in cell wall biosynthesis